MLDIAIGVVFVFLLLSVFATAVNEIILSSLNLRGKFLLRGIQTLLNEEPLPTTLLQTLVRWIAPVRSKAWAAVADAKMLEAKAVAAAPVILPASTSKAIRHLVFGAAPSAAAETPAPAVPPVAPAAIAPRPPITLLSSIYNHGQICGLYKGPFSLANVELVKKFLPSYIPARNFSIALLDSVEDAAAEVRTLPNYVTPTQLKLPAAAAGAIAISQELVDAAQTLAAYPPTDKVGKPLLSMIVMTGNDLNKLRQSVEQWYNSGMDRVSGWYKHRTQWVLCAIGLTIAVVLNASTIDIVRQLSKDPTLRQSIVAAAQNAKPPQDATAGLPIDQQITAARSSFAGITEIGVPFGWPQGTPRLTAVVHHPFTRCVWRPFFLSVFSGASVERLIGWIFTAIAVSLGAPFWFDALNKIMVVRSTVKPQEKSLDEKSKS
jgi:hypothetical protein